ncbi:hypothetical protein C4580_06490 [Candidatus Woesearchaeota archaeon]|nr:MAG: hypothetical protein C4580_06490 [Candidatus Woesearchaeota archaeon]
MNRRGDFSYVAGIILVAVALGVILGVMYVWKGKLTGQQEDTQCSAQLFLSAVVSKAPFASQIPVGCQMKIVPVNKERLDKEKKFAPAAVKRLQQPGSSARDFFLAPGSEDEWALNSIVADELKACWQKVFKGKLNLFSGGVTGSSVCILCSQLLFSTDLPGSFPSYARQGNERAQLILSLDSWMRNTPLPPKTVYDFLAEGQTVAPNSAQYAYSPKIPYGVVYMEVHPSLFAKVSSTTIGKIGIGVIFGATLLTPAGWGGLLVQVSTLAATGAIAAGSASQLVELYGLSAATAGVAPAVRYAQENGETARVLVLAPFSSIRKPLDENGLGCEVVIA